MLLSCEKSVFNATELFSRYFCCESLSSKLKRKKNFIVKQQQLNFQRTNKALKLVGEQKKVLNIL